MHFTFSYTLTKYQPLVQSPMLNLLIRIRSTRWLLLRWVRWIIGCHCYSQRAYRSLARSLSFSFFYLFISIKTLYFKVCDIGFYTLTHHICEIWSWHIYKMYLGLSLNLGVIVRHMFISLFLYYRDIFCCNACIFISYVY